MPTPQTQPNHRTFPLARGPKLGGVGRKLTSVAALGALLFTTAQSCILPVSEVVCTRYVGSVTGLITNEIVDVQWSDNSTDETAYQVRTRQIAVLPMTVTEYDLPADTERFTFLTNDFVVERPEAITVFGPDMEEAEFADIDPAEGCAPVDRTGIKTTGSVAGELTVSWSPQVMPELITGHEVAIYDRDPFFQSGAVLLGSATTNATTTFTTISGLPSGADVVAVVETCFGGDLAGICEPVHEPASTVVP